MAPFSLLPGETLLLQQTAIIPAGAATLTGLSVVFAVWFASRRRAARQLAARTRKLEENSRELRLSNLRLQDEMLATRQAEKARRMLEAKIQMNQRLESLGVLAGGIAHDFNNLLVGIMGSAELALREVEPDSRLERNLLDVLHSAERAADLCRQMLAYAGKAPFHTAELRLSDVVDGVGGLLRTSIAEHVTLRLDLDPGLPTIGADRSQVEQVIMNLVINAAEAIGDARGTITVKTSEYRLDHELLARHPQPYEVLEGRYACLEVSDTGGGMSPETQQKIFEPFFTTKFLGRGLGLAAVFGIVRRHRGLILVDSAQGEGTSLRVFFPVAEAPVSAVEQPSAQQLNLLDPEPAPLVLVVDDEEMVRNLASRALEREGFAVLQAEDGAAGVSTLREHKDAIRCVLLDLSMPKMDGESALHEIRRLRSDVPVVVMSGYSESQLGGRFSEGGIFEFLPKPFTLKQLTSAVHRAVRVGVPSRLEAD